MACMSPRITITCRVFASTSSMRTCDWTPTRLVSFRPTRPTTPFYARVAHVVEGPRPGPRFWRRLRPQSLGLRRRCERRREPDQVERHHATRPRPCESLRRQRVRPCQAAPSPTSRRQFELPVTYTGDVAYHREKWSALRRSTRTVSRATNFRAGLEYRLGAVELRGAGRISQGNWYPSGGAGFNLTRNFGVDAAALRHPDLPRDGAPYRVGHLPSLRQKVAHLASGSSRRAAR